MRNAPETPRPALVAGATGLVGRHLVSLLAADPGVPWIGLPVRRPIDPVALGTSSGQASKLRPVVVDFERLDVHAEIFRVSQVFVCLGTTLKQAGSREAFRRVDLEYALEVARRGLEGGAADLLVVTALGADERSRFFYSRVKGELENAVSALPYRSVALFRPSLLLGEREAPRPAERVAQAVAPLLSPLLPGPLARYRPVHAREVAAAMFAVARSPTPGVRIVESDEILRLARPG